jgi:hypothetical protein
LFEQYVHGLVGRFPIALSSSASDIVHAIRDVLVPKYHQLTMYYASFVHPMLILALPEDHPMRNPSLTPDMQIRMGEDLFWDYSVTRLIELKELPLDLYSEIVWVTGNQLLYMPQGYVHSSGPHPISFGYSIRSHVYLTPRDILQTRRFTIFVAIGY